MAVNWLLGVQQQNAGETFANAFQQGQQANMQNTARQAMAALVQNPSDPQALAALARVDPASAMAFRKQQIEEVKAKLGEHYDSVVRGAQIFRQFHPTDQQSYSQALAAAQAAGIDVSQVPQQYNPQYVDGVIKVADALKPDPNSDPGVAKDVAYYKSIGREDLAQAVLLNHANPQQPIQTANADGTIQVNWVRPPLPSASPGSPMPQGGGEMPSVASPQDAMKLPPGTQFRLPDGRIGTVPGGATASTPSPTFR